MDLRLYHNSHEFYYRSSFGAVPSGSRLILRLRAGGSDARNCRARIRLWPFASENVSIRGLTELVGSFMTICEE